MDQLVSILITSILILFLQGCATPTIMKSKDRAALIEQKISVGPVTTSDTAYKLPKGTWDSASGYHAVGYDGLAVALIEATVIAMQSHNFKSGYSQYVEKVKDVMPRDMNISVRNVLEKAIEQDKFFGPLITEDSPNKLVGEITSYGLLKPRDSDMFDSNLKFYITLHVKIMDPNDQARVSRRLTAFSKMSEPLNFYAKKPGLVVRAADEAIIALGVELDKAFVEMMEKPKRSHRNGV